jgi:GNAT superfamily N-acetyltransferase
VTGIQIGRLDAESFGSAIGDLSELLVDAVQGGASVGFIRPFTREAAGAWWRTLADGVASGELVILVAREGPRVVGTVQLHLVQKPNAPHRAEVAKLLVHSRARRKGVGRLLMDALEETARRESRSLLVLDTETESDAEHFYAALGWTRAAVIPHWAENPAGGLRGTTIYYKELSR